MYGWMVIGMGKDLCHGRRGPVPNAAVRNAPPQYCWRKRRATLRGELALACISEHLTTARTPYLEIKALHACLEAWRP